MTSALSRLDWRSHAIDEQQVIRAATSTCGTGKRSYATEADAQAALLSTRIAAALRDTYRRASNAAMSARTAGTGT